MNQYFRITGVFFLCLLYTNFISAQNQLVRIKTLFLKADSVILTSHIAPPEVIQQNEDINDRKLIVNGSINTKFIKERKLIDAPSILHLATVITKSFTD